MVVPPKLSIFVDADVLIAGSASTSGASHILLRLSEFTVIECLCSEQIPVETERNLIGKLPHALPMFRLLTRSALRIVQDPSVNLIESFAGQADAKDLPILVAAVEHTCHYLVTFNTKHYWPQRAEPVVVRPGELLGHIRERLAELIP